MKRNVEIIEVNSKWDPVEEDNNISDEFEKYLKENIEDIALSHIEAWEERYEGKSLSDIRFDLGVNFDLSGEATHIGDVYEEINGVKITDEENDYAQEKFVEAVIAVRKKELEELLDL